jgi:hypothetical protein
MPVEAELRPDVLEGAPAIPGRGEPLVAGDEGDPAMAELGQVEDRGSGPLVAVGSAAGIALFLFCTAFAFAYRRTVRRSEEVP